jgi:anthranilate synthase/aminodeoxychorismate synthase-like glutamine amidotransferase
VIVVIDNYDSFTYNLVHLLGSLGAPCQVVLNDAVDVRALSLMRPTALLLSPGPGTPDAAGVTLDAIAHFRGRVPMLGICLGHQAIAQSFGARVVAGGRLVHGKTSSVHHGGEGLFEGLPNPVPMARYNSLLVDESTLPPGLAVTSRSEHGEVMSIEHPGLAVWGVQFHPESALSPHGRQLVHNWLNRLRGADTVAGPTVREEPS